VAVVGSAAERGLPPVEEAKSRDFLVEPSTSRVLASPHTTQLRHSGSALCYPVAFDTTTTLEII
jgi:hypothetical protein